MLTMAAPQGQLLVMRPDGTSERIDNTHEAISKGLDGHWLEMVMVRREDPSYGFFIEEEGLLHGSRLNVPASMMASISIFGLAVLFGGADEEGETLPIGADTMRIGETFAHSWQRVIEYASLSGQDLTVIANADTVPPPEIIEMTEEAMEALFNGQTRRG